MAEQHAEMHVQPVCAYVGAAFQLHLRGGEFYFVTQWT